MSQSDPSGYRGDRVCKQEWAYRDKCRGPLAGIRMCSAHVVLDPLPLVVRPVGYVCIQSHMSPHKCIQTVKSDHSDDPHSHASGRVDP